MTRNGGMEYSNGLVGMFIREIMSLICVMVMERCIGKMEAITKEIGPMESSMVKVRSDDIYR